MVLLDSTIRLKVNFIVSHKNRQTWKSFMVPQYSRSWPLAHWYPHFSKLLKVKRYHVYWFLQIGFLENYILKESSWNLDLKNEFLKIILENWFVENYIWKLDLKFGFENWIWILDLKIGFENWIWKLVLKDGSESWIWKLDLKNEFESWIWKMVFLTVQTVFWTVLWQFCGQFFWPHWGFFMVPFGELVGVLLDTFWTMKISRAINKCPENCSTSFRLLKFYLKVLFESFILKVWFESLIWKFGLNVWFKGWIFYDFWKIF